MPLRKAKFFALKILLAGIALFAFITGAIQLGAEQTIPANIKLNPQGITSSAECGKCHKDIYSTWENSLHALASSNSVFQTAYKQAYFEIGENARRTCLQCHAPIALLNNDFKLTSKLTRESINCHYCHSISQTILDANGPAFQHQFDLLMQGPLKNVTSPVHKTRFNPMYKSSAFCKGCHEYQDEKGLKIIETFSEWAEGPYPAKNIDCQNCHMRKIAGTIVAKEIKNTPQTEISSHDIAGGHSLTMREKSIEIKIQDIRKTKQKVEVVIDITNKGAGHKIPTGLPSKKIVLEVSVRSKEGTIYQTQKKIYQKLLVDKNGREITDDSKIFIGVPEKVVSDNRIGPLETRREEFTFFVPKGKEQLVSAAVYYSHKPKIIIEAPINLKMNEVLQQIGP